MRKIEKKYWNRRSLGIETLEKRVLMDGDVTATFSTGSDLSVSGDSGDNQVVISRTAAGMIRVAGLDQTKVNGGEFAEFAGDLGDLKVNMRQGGVDSVAVQGAVQIAGNINARIGDGEFALEGSRGAVDVAGNVNFRGGDEGDVNFRNEVVIHGDVLVKTGGAVNAAAELGFAPNLASATFSDPLDINNPYFPLVPGTKWTYREESIDEDTGEPVVETIVVEVTNQTKTILGVVTRVVTDKVFVNGLMIEDTLDWHAQDDNGNVWYFGEDTTSFEYDDAGNLIDSSKSGSFEAGVDGAQAGIVMEAKPKVGDAYYQEFVPGIALDQGEVLAVNDTTTIPLGSFNKLVRTKDTTVLDPSGLEHKLYAPGLGFIREFKFDVSTGETVVDLQLVSVELNGQPVTQVVPPTGFNGTNQTGSGTGPVQFLGETRIRPDGPAIFVDARFSKSAQILSKTQVAVFDSTFSDRLLIFSQEDAGLTNVTAEDKVQFFGASLHVTDSTFMSDVNAKLSFADDELVVEGSSFTRLKVDGGRGDNTLEDGGENELGELTLRRIDVEVPLKEAKLNIEHNATALDTGFQGFIDSEGWKQLTVTDPNGDGVLSFEAKGALGDLGLTELFFETVEPANADVPIGEMLAKLPPGDYAVDGPAVAGRAIPGNATGTAPLTHSIPQGPSLLAPAAAAEVNENAAVTFDWAPVSQTIDGQAAKIIAYQVIIEKIELPHPNMIGKMGLSAYLPSAITNFTVPAGSLEPDTAYAWEVLAIEEGGNQTLSSSTFKTGNITITEPTVANDPPNLKEAKLIIEHNATAGDTGFQGFIDSEGWQRLDVKNPNGDVVLTFEGQNTLADLGVTELFFETVEPANADVPIEEVLAKMPAGNYTISGPSMENGESSGLTSGTALLTHTIPAGPQLLTPTQGATVADDLVVSWNPVTRTIQGGPVDIIAYQLIIEKDGEPDPNMIGKIGLSMYLPATTTSITVPGEVLEPGTNYLWEVLAIEASGNQTLSSSEFQTANA